MTELAVLTGWQISPHDPADVYHDNGNASGAPVSVDCRDAHLQRAQMTPSCVGYGLGQSIQDWDIQLLELDASITAQNVDGSTYRTSRKAFSAAVIDPLSHNWNWTLGRLYDLNDIGAPPTKDVGLPPDVGTSCRWAIAGMRDMMLRAEADWPDDPSRAKMVPDAAAAEAEPLIRIPDGGWQRIDTDNADDLLASLSAKLQGFKAGLNGKPVFAMPIGAAYYSTPEDGIYNLAAETGTTSGHEQTCGAVDVPNRLMFFHWTWGGMARGCWVRVDDFVKVTPEHGWVFTEIIYMKKVGA